MNHPRLAKRIALSTLVAGLAATLLLGGCAALPPGSQPDPRDRFERANRSVYAFNRALDRAVLRPVARAYVKATPGPVRRCIHNFLGNIDYPITVINEALQGKVVDSLKDVARFGINSVIGVGGLFDPATHWGFEQRRTTSATDDIGGKDCQGRATTIQIRIITT